MKDLPSIVSFAFFLKSIECYFDSASFLTKLSDNNKCLEFIGIIEMLYLIVDCWDMKNLLIKKSVYSSGTQFTVRSSSINCL